MRKTSRNIVYMLCFLTFGLFFTNANDFLVDFDVFVNDIVLVADSKQNISLIKFSNDFDKIKNNVCNVNYTNSFVEVSPVCFLNVDKNFNLDMQDSLSYLIEWLRWFSQYYNDSISFSYKPSEPLYDYSILDKYRQYQSTLYEKVVITYMENNNQKIMIDKKTFSKIMFDKFSFYLVPTNLENRSNCSLVNYRLAISKLEWLELKPWEELNLNSLISYDPRACKWNLWHNYMFFAGSCGASTQLFRLSLIMPKLTVIERYAHSKWRSYYYGDKITGDDAAMFENSKKFIVKNEFDTSLYFKVYEQWDFSYLVWVLPYKENWYSEVNKLSDGLKSSVYKRNYDMRWNLLNIYQFDSKYLSKHSGRS